MRTQSGGSTLKLIKRQSICLPPFERATHTHVLALSAPVNYARAATRSAPVTRRRSINARERALPANKNREKNDFTSGCMLWNLIVHAENVCRLGESRRQRRTYISLYTLYTQMHSRFMHPLKLDTFTLTIATRGCARINERTKLGTAISRRMNYPGENFVFLSLLQSQGESQVLSLC